jgi:hypothetical protein
VHHASQRTGFFPVSRPILFRAARRSTVLSERAFWRMLISAERGSRQRIYSETRDSAGTLGTKSGAVRRYITTGCLKAALRCREATQTIRDRGAGCLCARTSRHSSNVTYSLRGHAHYGTHLFGGESEKAGSWRLTGPTWYESVALPAHT